MSQYYSGAVNHHGLGKYLKKKTSDSSKTVYCSVGLHQRQRLCNLRKLPLSRLAIALAGILQCSQNLLLWAWMWVSSNTALFHAARVWSEWNKFSECGEDNAFLMSTLESLIFAFCGSICMNNETQFLPRVAAGRRCYPKFEGLRVYLRENSKVFWRERQKNFDCRWHSDVLSVVADT